jgi:hypothetical protein
MELLTVSTNFHGYVCQKNIIHISISDLILLPLFEYFKIKKVTEKIHLGNLLIILMCYHHF